MSKNDGSKNERSKLQEHAGQRKQKDKQRRKPDRRIRRTCERLGSALVALIQERPMDDVTVQDVLDRASVGRSTFYLHYSDKDDLLLSQLEEFLEMMSTALSMRKEESHRVVPVAELFAHIGSQKKLYRALADSGRLNDFFDLAQGYFARGIEQRLKESKRLSRLHLSNLRQSQRAQPESGARASALAGSVLSLLRWWLDRGAKESPRAMDELFHRMVWNGLDVNPTPDRSDR
jgi:AcrR family transcriptional regulator